MKANMKHTYFFFFLLALATISATGCSFEEATINKVKSESFKPLPGSWKDKYELIGYYSSDPIPMLVSDTMWLSINTPTPESEYVLLYGAGLKAAVKNPEEYYGALVRVRGIIQKNVLQIPGDSSSARTVFLVSSITRLSAGGGCSPNFINLCSQYPIICLPNPNPNANKFALLYSGGRNPGMAKKRYWNDLVFMYHTLRNKYGYAATNIVVVYKSGAPENTNMPVHFSASMSGFNQAITKLQGLMQNPQLDQLLVFTTNHGGGYDPATNIMNGETDQSTSDEPEASLPPPGKIDEVIFYYGSSLYMLDEYFATKINSLPAKMIIALHEPCFSGGLLHDLRHTDRINIAAAAETENSKSIPPCHYYDAFSYYFTAAMYGRNRDGTALSSNPDLNASGSVSVLEAFLFARSNDGSSHHFLDDTGNGIGVEVPGSLNPALDGFVAARTFF